MASLRDAAVLSALLAAPAAAQEPFPAPCAAAPHCVSSVPGTPARRLLPPIAYQGSPEVALGRLAELLSASPRARIVERGPDRLRAVFTSPLLRFKDDVEFFFPAGQKLIHFRSSSRVGYYDFGVNRRRIERLRRALAP